MANSFFSFKQFTVQQDACAMKVCTDACLFGAWCAQELSATSPQTFLDIGTGTGLLSLMILQKNVVLADAIEIDADAAQQAKENAAASPWHKSITVHNADARNMDILKKYDVIISNPPFYETDLQSPDNKRNLAHHNKQLNLQALCEICTLHLKKSGVFFLLLPFKRKSEVAKLLHQNGLHIYKEAAVKQTPAHAPFRVMLKCGWKEKNPKTETFIIRDDAQQYTMQFTELLQAYYLNL